MNIDEILEAAMADFFWVPSHVETVERRELAYSSSPNTSPDYNRVVRARPADAAPEALVDEVAKAHRGGPSRWCINPMSDTPAMRRALDDGGYNQGQRHFGYAIRVVDYRREPPASVDMRQIESVEDLETSYRLLADIFGHAPKLSDDDIAAELAACTGPDRRVARFIAYSHDEPAGLGGITFFDDLSFGLIWAGGVVEQHRGQGVYTALLVARARAAAQRGIKSLGLYAQADTSAPIVAAHGFERCGEMTYFDRDFRVK